MFRFVSGSILALAISAAGVASPPDAVDDTANFSGNARLELHRTDTLFSSVQANRLRQSVQLTDGGAIFAWDHGFAEDYVTPPAEFSIYAQRYDAAGDQSGGVVDLLPGFNMENVDSWSFVNAGTGFALIVREEVGALTTHTIRYYDAAGTMTDGPHTLDMDGADLYAPRQEITILPNGSIVYPRDDNGGTGDSLGVFFMLLDADGDRIANEIRANQTTVQFEQRLGQVVAFTDNRFGFLISDDSPASTSVQQIIAQIFNSDGSVSGSELLLGSNNTPGGRFEDNLDARVLPDSTVLMLAFAGENDDVFGVIPDNEAPHIQDEHLYTQQFSNTLGALAPPAAFSGIRYLPESSSESTPSSTYTMGRRSWHMRTDGTSVFRWERENSASSSVTSGVMLDPSGRPMTGLFEIDNAWDRYPMAFVGGNLLIWRRVSDGLGGINILLDVHDIEGSSFGFIDVLANDSDPDIDPFAITQIDGQAAPDIGDIVALGDGTTAINANNRLYYSGGAGTQIAAADAPTAAMRVNSFTYAVADAEGSDTATVFLNLVGGPANLPPIADDDLIVVSAKTPAADYTATLLTGDDDPNNPDLSQVSITSVFTGSTAGLATLNAGAVTYDPNGAFDALDQGDVGADQFSYILTGPGGLSDIGLVSVTVNGVNDAPVAGDVGVTLGEKSPATGIRTNILAQASDVDADDVGNLIITAVDTTGTMGSVTLLPSGAISYDPNGAFNALDDGQSDTDTFIATVSDALGASDTATVTMTINGASHTFTASTSGLGTGNVVSTPAGVDCGNGGASCTAEIDTEVATSLLATPAAGSLFDEWETGPCAGTSTNPCAFDMTGDLSADARFTIETPPAGRIVAATLPGARSGYVGGADVTAFLSVVSRATTPAQNCTVSADGGAPFTFSYRAVDGTNTAIGEANPRFDLAPGGLASFVIALTPTAATTGSGYVFQPIVSCDNATLDPIEGVNSVLLSFGTVPVPDVLSIGVTPSGDGVIRITTVPGAAFMSASAINIGAGDGLSGPGAVTVTAAVDTGAATLPLEISVCETDAGGVCLAPRAASVRTVIDADASFFAVFARDTGGPGVSFDPANARVFLRFTDDNGVVRSVTSAAVTSPGATDQPPAIMAGRWSVLVRTEDGIWPSLRRGHLIVLENGTAILDDGLAPRRVALQSDGISPDGYAAFRIGDLAGQARPDGALRLGNGAASTPGALWGVRDQRGDVSADLTLFAGRYGGITVAENGAIFGEVGGCSISAPAPSVYGAIHASTAGLSGCGDAGRYTIIFDAPANDAASPALIIAGETPGWRVTR